MKLIWGLILAVAILVVWGFLSLAFAAEPTHPGSVEDLCLNGRGTLTREQAMDTMIDRGWLPPDKAWAMPGGETWKWENRRVTGAVEKGTDFYMGFSTLRNNRAILSGCEECRGNKCGPNVK